MGERARRVFTSQAGATGRAVEAIQIGGDFDELGTGFQEIGILHLGRGKRGRHGISR